jgi:hypothetical protein
MDKLPTFDSVRYKNESELRRALVACRVDRILSDPVMNREYIEAAIEHEVINGCESRLDIIEALYDEGFWE